jgi:ubiquinone/menaquinone biosynthesis C-methylase UbiE
MRRGGGDVIHTLEIGAGLGEHIKYEDLTNQRYCVLELRDNMAEVIVRRFPHVAVKIGDIQSKTGYPDDEFDRILAIHVLEHLPDLPSALSEICRILKPEGFLTAVIPCEGGLAYALAREISTVRLFDKQFSDRGVSYRWLVRKTEHINTPNEILEELKERFTIVQRSYFPLKIPFVFCNLCIGLHMKKKNRS